MKKEAKIRLLKHFLTLEDKEIEKMANKKWTYLSECWGSYDEREKYKKDTPQIARGYSYTNMSEYYTYEESNYFLYDLGDKYFLEYACYMPGDGTDHWCWTFKKD